ncbi:MAG: class I SAM-dependent methyltransferase [Methanobacteriota archaeon]
MVAEWKVDPEVESALWAEIRADAIRAAHEAGGGRMLDLGGAAGSFTHYISSKVPGYKCVSIDITRPNVEPVCDFVMGDALRLPFRDSTFQVVAARAVLHHFPRSLGESMAELRRVLVPEGRLIIEEPCSGNPLAAIARKAFPTDRHDPGERPVAAGVMAEAVRACFNAVEVKHYFLASYLVPHVVSRMPDALKSLARHLGMAVYRADRRVLNSSHLARRAAAYVHISAIKGKK